MNFALRCHYFPGQSKSPSPSPVLKRRPDVEEDRGVTRCGSPVRLPHSPKPADNFQLIPSASMVVPSNNTQPDSKDDILPALCSCLFGLCGCATGLDLCAIGPKLCSLLAGLCGSLFHLGASPRQNHSSVTHQVSRLKQCL